jgi:hypothetical protein
MHGSGSGRRFAALGILLLLLGVGLTVGFLAYNAGVAHGVAVAAHAPALEQGAGEGARAVAPAPGYYGPGYYGYGWHPWGFGFFFGPVLFILFWFVLLRALFFRAWWGGPWRRHGYYGGYGYGCGPGRWQRGRYDDDWHRREPPAHL